MLKIVSKKTKGIFSAVGVGFLQGYEGLIFVLLGIFFVGSTFLSPSFSIATLAIKEFITMVFTIVLVKPSRAMRLIKLMLSSKKYIIYLLTGIFGTTFGNLFYLMAFQFAGAQYGGILTALYPIFSFLLIRFIHKEKDSKLVWLGVIVALLGSVCFTVVPTLVSDDSTFTRNTIIGIIFGLIAAIFWAGEGVLIYIASKIHDPKEKTQDAVLIRSYGTTFTSMFIFMPSLAIYSTFSSLTNPYTIFVDLIITWQSLLILVGISINLVILRYIHIYAISTIGAKITAIIDTNNFLIPPLFSVLLSYGAFKMMGSNDLIYTTPDWYVWLLIIPSLVGVFIVLYFHKSEDKHAIQLDHIGD